MLIFGRPVKRLVLQRDMEPLALGQMVERRDADRRVKLAELHRVFEVEIVTRRDAALIALDDRIGRGEFHALGRSIFAALGNQRVEIDFRR